MKTFKALLILTTLGLVVSCEVLDVDPNLSVAERLEGEWNVDEDTPELKSADQYYDTYIDINTADSSQIYISDFYGIGDDYYAYADIGEGLTIILPQQVIGDNTAQYTVYGSASISANYKQLTWSFYVDEGTGFWEEVTAIYTKKEY